MTTVPADHGPDDWERAGLYDPAAPDAGERLALLSFLADNDISLDEMKAKTGGPALHRAAVDRVLHVGGPYTTAAASEATGLAPALIDRVWLAAGFPPIPAGVEMLGDDDLVVLRACSVAVELFGVEPALQFTRVMGSSLRRIAEAAVAAFLVNVEAPLVEAGLLARTVASVDAARRLTDLPAVFDPLFRRHVESAVEQSRVGRDAERYDTFTLTVGFCDLVGYTAWSRNLAPEDLAAAVGEFEQVANELITAAGARVAKNIGDAVLYVSADRATAARVATELCAFVDAHPVLTRLRAAVATGDVIALSGDYYGPTVNLAARLVKVAQPGTVVADGPVQGFDSEPVPVPPLPGIEEVPEVVRLLPRR